MAEEQTIVETPAADEGGDKGGSVAKPWLTSVPESFRDNEEINALEKASDVWPKLIELSEKAKNGIVIPKEDATDEEKTAFYQKLGRPETPDKYTITKPEGLPDDMPYEASVETWFKDVSFELGLSAAQANALYSKYWNFAKGGFIGESEANKKAVEVSVNALKDEWKGDAFKANTAIATRAWTELGKGHDDFLLKKVDGMKLGDHPEFLRLFNEIGKKILPDTAIGDGTIGRGEGEITKEDVTKAWFPKSPSMIKK